MKWSFFPGCTLKTRAKDLEKSALAATALLGIDLVELPSWNCCGAVYSLADDDIIHRLAPVRILMRAREQNMNGVVTLCSMCYNTLARANQMMKLEADKRETINRFMDDEEDYHGEVEVIHLLNLIRDEIGWDALKSKVQVSLKGLKLAPYYGCTLQRPREIAIEPPGSFRLMSALLEGLGASVLDFPDADRCCGSYEVLVNPTASAHAAGAVLNGAVNEGADALVMTCPLCEFNLGKKQDALLQEEIIPRPVPTFYFTQLMALALGLGPEVCGFTNAQDRCVRLLREKKILR